MPTNTERLAKSFNPQPGPTDLALAEQIVKDIFRHTHGHLGWSTWIVNDMIHRRPKDFRTLANRLRRNYAVLVDVDAEAYVRKAYNLKPLKSLKET